MPTSPTPTRFRAVESTEQRLSGRVVVVSPHLDDAVMSLGATIAQAVRAGADLVVLTVFAYIPSSEALAGPWDTSCGYSTEGQAARARREEDRRACLILGAKPRWLDFGAEPYERRGSQDEIWSAVEAETRGADAVLLPGYPLTHPDHSELSELLLRKGLSCGALALYAEQPYQFWKRKIPLVSSIAPALQDLIGGSLTWSRVLTDSEYRGIKRRAVQSYRSQLRHLGLGAFGLRRMIWHEAAQGGEALAWLPRRADG
jgi:LmbE family N-acetylglucosaminyl deacetylase